MALHVRILRGEGGADVVSAALRPLELSKELSSRRCINKLPGRTQVPPRPDSESSQGVQGEGGNCHHNDHHHDEHDHHHDSKRHGHDLPEGDRHRCHGRDRHHRIEARRRRRHGRDGDSRR